MQFEMMNEAFVCEVALAILTAPLLTVCENRHGRGEIFEIYTAFVWLLLCCHLYTGP